MIISRKLRVHRTHYHSLNCLLINILEQSLVFLVFNVLLYLWYLKHVLWNVFQILWQFQGAAIKLRHLILFKTYTVVKSLIFVFPFNHHIDYILFLQGFNEAILIYIRQIHRLQPLIRLVLQCAGHPLALLVAPLPVILPDLHLPKPLPLITLPPLANLLARPLASPAPVVTPDVVLAAP